MTRLPELECLTVQIYGFFQVLHSTDLSEPLEGEICEVFQGMISFGMPGRAEFECLTL